MATSYSPQHLRNNHVPLPPHLLLVPLPPNQQSAPVEDFFLPKALAASSVKLPIGVMRPLSSPKDWVAEFIYVLRPLVYGKHVRETAYED